MLKQYAVVWIAVGCLLASGCATLPNTSLMDTSPIEPNADEFVIAEHVLMVIDGTSSMVSGQNFYEARDRALSIVASMPTDDYTFGVLEFSGHESVSVPLSTFDRNEAASTISVLEPIGGNTPMANSIDEIESMLSGKTGRIVVFFLSDGRADDPDATLAAVESLASMHDEICIIPIQFGSSVAGQELLKNMATVTGCGHCYHTSELDDQGIMHLMITRAFFGVMPDTDGDGVFDMYDECPGTPKGAKVDERGCWVIPGVLFDYDKYVVKPEYASKLNEAIVVLKANPGLRVYVDGHTDSNGPLPYNQTLSENRAAAVVDYMVNVGGIEANRLVPRGFGETQPVVPNISSENRQKNRRVELRLIN